MVETTEQIANLDPSERPSDGRTAPIRVEGSTIALPRCVDELQDALIRAHALERREPGGGKWPFAGDGPWHLIQGEQGDYAGEGTDGVSSEVEPRPPLDAEEVAELRTLRSWLQLIPDTSYPRDPAYRGDRKVVWIATARLHAGEGRVPWKALGKWMRSCRDPDTLALRYRLALARVVCRLNGWPERRARRMAA